MISALKKYLENVFESEVYEDDQRSLRLACTVMMFEVLRADTQIHPDEVAKINQHVQHAFGLDQEETRILMQHAQKEAENSISLHDMVRAVNEAYGAEEKRDLIRMLWDVAYADGDLDRYEELMIRNLADWLYVPHKDFIQTKHEAAATD